MQNVYSLFCVCTFILTLWVVHFPCRPSLQRLISPQSSELGTYTLTDSELNGACRHWRPLLRLQPLKTRKASYTTPLKQTAQMSPQSLLCCCQHSLCYRCDLICVRHICMCASNTAIASAAYVQCNTLRPKTSHHKSQMMGKLYRPPDDCSDL